MRALLVGGPLHGKLIPIESEDLVKVYSKHDDGETYEYIRHNNYPMAGKDWVLFMRGAVDANQVIDAIQQSDLTNTSKLRAIGVDYSYLKINSF